MTIIAACRQQGNGIGSSLLVKMVVSLLWLVPIASAFQAPGFTTKKHAVSSPPLQPSPKAITTMPTRSSSQVLFTAKNKHAAYHSTLMSRSYSSSCAASTSLFGNCLSRAHPNADTKKTATGRCKESASSSSLLFATASNSNSNSPDHPTLTLAKKITSVLLYPLRNWIWKPIRWLLQKLFVRKKSLKQDFQDKLHMLTDEQVVNGDASSAAVVSVVSTPSTAAPGAVTHAASKASTEGDVTKVVTVDDTEEEKETTSSAVATAVVKKEQQPGTKWAVSAPNVDLTGKWTMLVSEEFKKQYDEYLKKLGQPLLVRSVALSIVGMTTEETIQTNDGRELLIRGRNARGVWERTLVTCLSGQAKNFDPIPLKIETADAETVEAEAWWENSGKVHKSWIYGGTKYGGGDFESSRYLEDNDKVLVCESVFHPNDPEREKARVTWKFLRDETKN